MTVGRHRLVRPLQGRVLSGQPYRRDTPDAIECVPFRDDGSTLPTGAANDRHASRILCMLPKEEDWLRDLEGDRNPQITIRPRIAGLAQFSIRLLFVARGFSRSSTRDGGVESSREKPDPEHECGEIDTTNAARPAGSNLQPSENVGDQNARTP